MKLKKCEPKRVNKIKVLKKMWIQDNKQKWNQKKYVKRKNSHTRELVFDVVLLKHG